MEKSISKPISVLDNTLIKLIDKEINNIELKKILMEEYLSNGLTPSTINSLFAGEKFVNLLGDKEKLILLRGFNKFFENLDLKEEEYFSDNIINRVDNDLGEIKYEDVREINLKNLLRVDEDTYTGVISYEDMYKYMENNLLIYNMDLQREGTYVRFSNSYIKVPTIDNKSVENIIKCMENNTLETNAITLGYLLKPDSIPEFDIVDKNDILSDINASSLLIIDGMHRIMASIKYCSKLLSEGKKIPDRKFILKVVIGDKAKLKNTVNQSFLQSNVSKEYLSSITDDDYTRFIDKVIEQSDILRDNVASSFEEYKYLNKITTKETLRKVVEYLDIQVNSKATAMFESKALAENLDILIEMLKQNDRYLDYYNMYIPYMIFAYNIKKYNNDMKFYDEFMNRVKYTDIKELKLGLKNYSMTKLIEHFNVFEVNNNE